MVKKVKKYFILPISLLLVLSNFSFATHQMLCLMSEDEDVVSSCTCSHDESAQLPSVITISSVSSPCCENRTIELNNSNNLQIAVTKLLKDITSFSPVLLNIETGNSDYFGRYIPNINFKDHIPRADIPILISSLLI